MRVKPAPGLKIRHPVTKEMHDEHGEPITVADNDLFWVKLLEQRDVVKVEDDKPKSAA